MRPSFIFPIPDSYWVGINKGLGQIFKLNQMKKLLIIPILLIFSCVVSAQSTFSLTDGQSVLVYSLPKTEFCFEITVEKITEKPGMFYRYSERYLATNNVITQEKTSYRLIDIKATPNAVADANRTFSFVPTKKSASAHLNVNSDGILCGVNVAATPECKVACCKSKNATTETIRPSLLPLGEEYMMAGSEAKLAEGAAKQIYRIRESRLGILTADMEKLPADGDSFASTMGGLARMEKELTELFIGKVTKEIQTQRIYLTPTAAINNEILFRLSAFKGIVATTDLSGAPYYITLTPATVVLAPANPKAKKTPADLHYILPATSVLTIGDGVSTFYKNSFDIPQLGAVIPLANDMLKNPKTKVKIDSQTGRLLSVEE